MNAVKPLMNMLPILYQLLDFGKRNIWLRLGWLMADRSHRGEFLIGLVLGRLLPDGLLLLLLLDEHVVHVDEELLLRAQRPAMRESASK